MAQIKVYRERHREPRNAMSLNALLPQATWSHLDSGFYVWLTLPDGVKAAQAMLTRAVTERVAYEPGAAFFADGTGPGNVRLSYCYPDPDRVREGVRRFAAVVASELEQLRPSVPMMPLGTAPVYAQVYSSPPTSRDALDEIQRALWGARSAGVGHCLHFPVSEDCDMRHILVLAGGLSEERDVSLRSGRRLADALASSGAETYVRDVGPSLLGAIKSTRPEVIWPVLHGASGEDGTLRDVLGA